MFEPYKVEEIRDIIKDRLTGLEPGTPLTPSNFSQVPPTNTTPFKKDSLQQVQIMQPMAIELTARKLAGTGDLRKALDVCRYFSLSSNFQSNLL